MDSDIVLFHGYLYINDVDLVSELGVCYDKSSLKVLMLNLKPFSISDNLTAVSRTQKYLHGVGLC